MRQSSHENKASGPGHRLSRNDPSILPDKSEFLEAWHELPTRRSEFLRREKRYLAFFHAQKRSDAENHSLLTCGLVWECAELPNPRQDPSRGFPFDLS